MSSNRCSGLSSGSSLRDSHPAHVSETSEDLFGGYLGATVEERGVGKDRLEVMWDLESG